MKMISREGTKITKTTKKDHDAFASFVSFVSSCEMRKVDSRFRGNDEK
jgi:hypothetical protein